MTWGITIKMDKKPLAIKHGNGTSTCIDHVPINDPIFIGLSIPRFDY